MVISKILKHIAKTLCIVFGKVFKEHIVVSVCVALIIAELVAGTIILKNKYTAVHAEMMVAHADEQMLVLIREDDPTLPHCNCEEICWAKIGVNKLCGCDIYHCISCKNYVEPIIMDDGRFERLTLLDLQELKERTHPGK